jgi:hypothetical protein
LKSKKIFDIDSKDFFWKENAFQPFPNAATNVDKETNSYKQEVEQVLRSTGKGSLEEVNQMQVFD